VEEYSTSLPARGVGIVEGVDTSLAEAGSSVDFDFFTADRSHSEEGFRFVLGVEFLEDIGDKTVVEG